MKYIKHQIKLANKLVCPAVMSEAANIAFLWALPPAEELDIRPPERQIPVDTPMDSPAFGRALLSCSHALSSPSFIMICRNSQQENL